MGALCSQQPTTLPDVDYYYKSQQRIPMIMHDQEPLNFDLYCNIHTTEIKQCLKNNFPKEIMLQRPDFLSAHLEYLCDKNLKFVAWTNTIADRWLLCHSELNSVEVDRYKAIGFEPVYWWNHAMLARDWYRYAQFDPRLAHNNTEFPWMFNVYNRAWTGTREYRLKFTEMIVQSDLLKHTKITFNPWDGQEHYQAHSFQNSGFAISTDLSHLPESTANSHSSADYSNQDYAICAADVVLETLFDDRRIHLTEKTLRPIACGKPFLLAAPAGSLQVLKDYGFRTFSPWIDESYDCIDDPVDRLQSIIQSMRTLASNPTLIKHCYEIAQYNRQWFWSQEFANQLVDEFQHNYQKAVIPCRESLTGVQIRNYHQHMLTTCGQAYRDFLDQSIYKEPRQRLLGSL